MNAELTSLYVDYLRNEAPVIVLQLDATGRIIEANNYARQVIGEHLIHKRIFNVILDFRKTLDVEKLGRNPDEELMLDVCTSSGLPLTILFRFVRENGQIIAFGRQDMRGQEHMQREMVEMNGELNNLTRDLHKQNAELNRLNELKNQFLGMAAHDLRNPASAIYSWSDFLYSTAQDNLDAEQMRFIKIIRDESDSMIHLIRDFLDVSVLESGKLKIVRDEHNITNVISRAKSLCEPRAAAKNIRIEIDDSEPVPPTFIDCEKIEQVVSNLIQNAVQHSHEGSTVYVKARREDQKIVVSIIDQGVGIPEEAIPGLFEFFAGGVSRKTGNEKSTGLGLVIARMIVEQHKGRIWVESKPGKGATFSFSLPLQSKEEA